MATKKTTKKTVQTKKEKNTPLKKAAEKLEKAVSEDKMKRGKTDMSSVKTRPSAKKTEPVKTENKEDVSSIFSKKPETSVQKENEIKTSSVFTKRENIFDSKNTAEKEDIFAKKEEKKEEKKSSETLSELIASKQKELAKKEETEKASGTYSKNTFAGAQSSSSSQSSSSDAYKTKTETPVVSASSYKPAAQNTPIHKYGTSPYTYNNKKKSILFPVSIIIAVLAFALVVTGLYFLIIRPSSKMNASSSNTAETVIIENSPEVTSASNETMTETNMAVSNENNIVLENTNAMPEPESIPAAPLTPALNAKEYVIQWKDSMSTIAAKQLGDERRWVTIYKMNTDVIPSPDKYTFGTKIKLPADKKRAEDMSKEELSSLISDYDYTIDRYKKMNVAGEAKRLSAVRDNLVSIMNKK